MFRRRIPPRRRRFPPGPRPLRPRTPAVRAALKQLQHAHNLMAQGKPAEAAPILEALADKAEARGIVRAPQLNLQAGRAWLEAKETERAFARLRKGLQLMQSMGQWHRLQAAGPRVLADMRQHDLTDEATALEAELKEILAQGGLTLGRAPVGERAHRLPAKCPYCGGTVMSDEVDWVEDGRAVCDYCGSILEA